MDAIITAVIVLAGSGLLCGTLLAIASSRFSVKVNPLEAEIKEVLPGANCGGCGFSGCDGYAAALAAGKCATNLCIPGADAVSMKISEIMGVPFQDVVEQVAYVKCHGDCNTAAIKFDYEGVETCRSAKIMYGSKWMCSNGCLGYGDCAKVCPNGAICLENGIAHVDARKCSGCGLCVRTCPQKVISLIPDVVKTVVTCSSHDTGAKTHAACTNGCLGCHKCEKNCPQGAISIIDNLAVIDYGKCIKCGECSKVCPVHCIKDADFSGIHR